jgi:hypothetical protein
MLRVSHVRVLFGLVFGLLLIAPAIASAERMRCSSVDYKYAFCRTDRPIERVRLARRYSKRACIQGRSWGWDRRGIWVNHGCDADFDFRMRDRDRDRYR